MPPDPKLHSTKMIDFEGEKINHGFCAECDEKINNTLCPKCNKPLNDSVRVLPAPHA